MRRVKIGKAYLNVSRSKHRTEKLLRTGLDIQLQCVEKAVVQVKKWLHKMDVLELLSWLSDKPEVIPQNFAQQKQMLDTHMHSGKNHIASLTQTHVRRTNRGKQPNPTEFGPKYIFLW